MSDFLRTRAGKQFLCLLVLGLALWLLGIELQFQQNLLGFLEAYRSYGAEAVVLALNIGGAMSFLYSIFRIYDLRKEMDLRAKAQARADWTATHDHLTKLPNRYAFERRLFGRRQMRSSDDDGEPEDQTVTVFSVDLDGFKKVNDLVGHKGGDALLIEVARRLSALGDVGCVYRFGGDEFIVVATGLTREREEKFARMIIHALTRPIHIGSLPAEVGASIGYATTTMADANLEEAAHCADLAMYEAKSQGPNRYFAYEEAMQNKVTERAALESKLRAAIQENEIRPFYQPLINLRSGDICGFEALARWTDNDGISIPPPAFIGIAEETGMITELFENLLKQACLDARHWPDHITLSFNVSPVQMEDKLLATRILRILAKGQLPPHRLEIEITENALIQEPEIAALILDELHGAGVQIALDDFGTGYSSLAQLARYRFDKIKIDKSFVATYGSEERQEKIVRAMLGLGRSLGIKTTAEGIEEHSQLVYLVNHGCDIGQGYLFGKAVPADQAIAFIASRESDLPSLNQA
ncbi:EAL domain-containing protein [Rhizobium sp. BK376]|uniref:putative bifunctional diguanylate cyclase/phosphodiesterase n=1 Tax=Rhizobium sp. BK376 TaxID=2512149 RepID=UPI001050B1BB|nr:EAL domain-containing protein [Rhizobium sp. BK376]TCR82478.1 diguanylate cyclase/phosphodiesterase [Rhizobium sp. BK376]